MQHQAIEHFLVTVRRNTGSKTNNVSVQKIEGGVAEIQRLARGQVNEFIVHDDKASEMARASNGTAPQMPAPDASAATAWRSMPGGWATLAAAGGAAAIAAHGAYPLHDGIARVAAGKIIPPSAGSSFAAMPGGWATLNR